VEQMALLIENACVLLRYRNNKKAFFKVPYLIKLS
jgi:hypothetical protein